MDFTVRVFNRSNARPFCFDRVCDRAVRSSMVMEIIVVSSSSVSTYSMNPEVTKSFQVYPVSSFSCQELYVSNVS